MKKYKLKVSVVSYEEKEVYADNEEEAYEKIYDSINKVGDLNCNSKARVEALEYFDYEVIEEKEVEEYEIRIPIVGYYTTRVNSTSIEDALIELKDKAIYNLYNLNETNDIGISELKLVEEEYKIKPEIKYSTIKEEVTINKNILDDNVYDINNRKITVVEDLKDTKYENLDRKVLEDTTSNFE
jgi:hypothetical protein